MSLNQAEPNKGKAQQFPWIYIEPDEQIIGCVVQL